MPSIRASSIPLPGTPLRTPAIDRLAPGSTRSTRSSSHTPTTKHDSESHHHHKTADEIMLSEAERILTRTPTGRRLRSNDTPVSPGGSARELRHAKLVEAREKEEKESLATGSRTSRETSAVSEVGENTPTTSRLVSDDTSASRRKGKAKAKDQNSSAGSVVDDQEEEGDISRGEKISHLGIFDDKIDNQLQPNSANSISTEGVSTLEGDPMDSNHLAAGMDDEGSVIVARLSGDESDVTVKDGETDSESDQSESDEESDSEDDTSESDDDEDDSEDSEEEDERLEKLLQAAKISALSQTTSASDHKAADTNGEVVLQFEEQEKKEAPIPDLAIPSLPPAHISFAKNGSAKATAPPLAIPSKMKKSSKGKEKAPELEMDNRPYERELSKRENAAQPKKATASELWATIPSARRDALPQMKRDYQALALANSLDPKRFMKGGAKAATKVPESFAIGTLVEQPRHLQATTLTREARYRPGQIVQSLTRDEDMNATAKRKYGDLQGKRMDNGRGKGWKKRSKW